MRYKNQQKDTREKYSSERIGWEFQRTLYSFRRGPVWALILLQIAAGLLVASKGAGTIYMDMLLLLILITVISCFMTDFVHGNQKIILFSNMLLTIGTMLQCIFKQEVILKYPDRYAGGSPSAGLQLQYLMAIFLALLAGFLYWNFRECSSMKMAERFTILSFGLSLLTLLFAHSVGNVRNWISIGGISFQTTEVVKLFYIFIAAILLGTVEKPDRGRIIAFYVITCVEIGFLIIQSEFGTLLLILMVFLTFLFLFVPDLRIFFLTLVTMLGGAGMITLVGIQMDRFVQKGTLSNTNPFIRIYLSNYHKIANRFLYWMHPEKDSLGQGYQLLKAKESIVLGGWFGTSSVTDLPVKTSDLVFPALIQRCGMIFALLVFLIFILVWLEGMKICVRKKDKYHQMMAVGLTSMFLDQTIIIIAGSTGLCPLTGITLPLISSGGSSLVVSFILVSVLVCISGNISWKGQCSEDVRFFEKSTDCAGRIAAFGYHHVCIFIQNLGFASRSLRRSRSEKGGSETGRV